MIDDSVLQSGRAWIRDSLDRGGPFAQKVIDGEPRISNVELSTSADSRIEDLIPFDDASRGLLSRDSFSCMKEMLTSLVNSRTLLVIEDDLGQRGDSNVGSQVVFVGNRIVRAYPLRNQDDVSRAILGLRIGSSGYPTNALIIDLEDSIPGLDLFRPFDSIELDASLVEHLVQHAVAIIVSVFDGEAFLLGTLAPIQS